AKLIPDCRINLFTGALTFTCGNKIVELLSCLLAAHIQRCLDPFPGTIQEGTDSFIDALEHLLAIGFWQFAPEVLSESVFPLKMESMETKLLQEIGMRSRLFI